MRKWILVSAMVLNLSSLVFSFQTTVVTDNNTQDYWPHISGGNVAWQGYDGNDEEIFFWDGTTITQITNNDYDDTKPQISGTNVVWIDEGLAHTRALFGRDLRQFCKVFVLY